MWIVAPYVLGAVLVQSSPSQAPSWFGPGDVTNAPPPTIAPAPPPGASRPVAIPEPPGARRVRDQRIVGAIALASLALITIASLRLRLPVALRR